MYRGELARLPGHQAIRDSASIASWRIFAALVLVLLAGSSAAVRAANIQASDDQLCAFKLEGEIIQGDNDRLVSLVKHSHFEPLSGERTSTICLKSPGGSLIEGLKIAETIYTNDMSTLVADGSRCFSACAIIFMAGVVPEHAVPYRKLSAGGVLGFHAPSLSVKENKYSKEDVEDAADAMRQAILSLVRLSEKHTQLSGNDFIKKSLIVELLEKGPQDLFLVRTIGEAARLNIEIYDYADLAPKPSTVDAMKNLCINFHYSNIDEPVPAPLPELSLKVEKYASKYFKDDFRILVRDARTSDTVCEVYARTDKARPEEVHYRACSYDYWTDKSFGDCRAYKTSVLFGKTVPEYFTLAPRTILKRFQ
jgi:hypothetical protein